MASIGALVGLPRLAAYNATKGGLLQLTRTWRQPALFLVSDAAAYITGTVPSVDGGWTATWVGAGFPLASEGPFRYAGERCG